MNRKISLGIAISLAAIACAVTFVITCTVTLNTYNDKIADVQQREEINTRMQEIDSFIRSYSIYPIDDNAIKTGVYSGYLDGINDKRARYYTTNEYYYKTCLENGRLVGFGMETGREEGGYLKITEVYDNSPASEAGISAGDVITSIGGVSVLETGFKTAAEQIKYGDEGTKQRFLIRRSGEETEYVLTRQSFEIPSVKGVLLDNGILYLGFRAINGVTAAQLEAILEENKNNGVSGYIFDLRDCSGGYYSPVSGILNSFVGGTELASAVYRNNSTKTIAETTGEGFTNLPISIIINEKTGGAAELIAVSLRDFNSAKTVGTVTMGYGTVEETKAFADGTAIEISVATVRTVNEGSIYNEVGVNPEFSVEYKGIKEADPLNYAATTDEQLKKAVEVISTAANATAS